MNQRSVKYCKKHRIAVLTYNVLTTFLPIHKFTPSNILISHLLKWWWLRMAKNADASHRHKVENVLTFSIGNAGTKND